MSICHIAGCTNNIECPTMGICKCCYSSMYYWSRKTPKALLKRANDLIRFESRVNAMIPVNIKISRPPIQVIHVLPGSKKQYKRKLKQSKVA